MTDTADQTSSLAEELRWASAGATAARVRSGELTPKQVVEAAFERIEAAEPTLNAFIRLRRAEALAEAEIVSDRLAQGEYLPLAGVPVAVKDDAPMEGVVVSHGSRAYTQPSPEDAATFKLIRAAGGVLVGATRTPEFCLTPFCESDLGGATRNPWDPSRTPGGSSGGSAAAVSAGLVPLALGGDGGGSIRGPAAWCGLPGLYPTPGSVTMEPMGEIWGGLAVQGGFGRTIADTALLYDVLLTEPQGLAAAVTEETPKLRIALSLDRAMDRPIPQGGRISEAWVRASDLTATLLGQLGHEVEPVRVKFGNAATKFSIRYMVEIGKEVDETDAPKQIEKGTRLLVRMGRPLRPLMRWAMNVAAECKAVEQSLEGFDLLLSPTMPCSAPPVGERDGVPSIVTSFKASQRVSFLSTWNLLGWCGISVPAGVDAQGLPVAVLLTGRPGSERQLLQIAAQLERERPWDFPTTKAT